MSDDDVNEEEPNDEPKTEGDETEKKPAAKKKTPVPVVVDKHELSGLGAVLGQLNARLENIEKQLTPNKEEENDDTEEEPKREEKSTGRIRLWRHF